MQASIYLLEIGAETGAGPITLRYSAGGYTSGPGDDPANTYYADRIESLGKFSQHMFSPGRTLGAAVMELGAITLANVDGGLDGLRDYRFDGQTVRLLRLDRPGAPYGSAEVMVVATAERIDWTDGDAPRLHFFDRRRLLDKPLLSARYAGTTLAGGQGTAEGTPDMKGQVKRKVWGRALNVEAVNVNPFDVLLQFSDGPLASLALMDGGIALDYDGDNADIAGLLATAQRPGHYRSALALGLAHPGGSMSGRAGFVWTADVAEGASAAQRRAGGVARRMLAHMGIPDAQIDLARFAALDAEATAEIGVVVESEASAASVLREVLDSVGAWLGVDALGRFTTGRFTGVGSPLGVIAERDLIGGAFGVEDNPDTDGGIPAGRLTLKWGKVWRVLGTSEIAGDVSVGAPARAEALGQEWREVVIDIPFTPARPLAPELSFSTFLVNRDEAEAEAARRAALYGAERQVARIVLTRETAANMALGTSWTLAIERLGFEAGKTMVVIGREADPDAETVALWLWG